MERTSGRACPIFTLNDYMGWPDGYASMEIINHVFKEAKFEFSPNHGAEFDLRLLDTIILHYTASSTSESAIKTLTDPLSKCSSHLVIGRNADVIQLVPFNIIARHAGKSNFKNRIEMNNYSIGIEIENAGKLDEFNGSYLAWFGKKYDISEVVEVLNWGGENQTYWHKYDDTQIDKVISVCRKLIRYYKIKHILGHDFVSPGRKIDPGPAFPWFRLHKAIDRSIFQ